MQEYTTDWVFYARQAVELGVIAVTLFLGVFELSGDWELFRVGYLYAPHIIALCLDSLHGTRCVFNTHEGHAGKVVSHADHRAVNDGRVCYATVIAASGALMADALVLGQGARELHSHKATTEYVQLSLVCVLLAVSLWRLGLHTLDHWGKKDIIMGATRAEVVSLVTPSGR